MSSLLLATTCIESCKSNSKTAGDSDEPTYDIVTYVWSGAETMPDPATVTAINYGFANMNENRDGVVINNEPRFRKMIGLKKQKPELKIILCIGGDCNSGLSEMAADPLKRASLAGDCASIIKRYGIDGIDFDWEVPGGPGGTPHDVDNFTLVLQQVRDSIGPDKILSLASGGDISFNVDPVLPLIDYVSIMAYDLGGQAPWHHTALYRSPNTGWHSVDEVVQIYHQAGVPYDKMLLGLGFYGRGDDNYYAGWTSYSAANPYADLSAQWDTIACVPYIADAQGNLVLGYEDPESLKIKCEYLKEKGMRGAMSWRTETDTDSLTLARAVSSYLRH
ncbi:MAG: glycosyl hydrolase family 18 protein [Clostridiales bacterium]|nr:glycosyl hydrolase family 18 protein [Clostridiales bacterium]